MFGLYVRECILLSSVHACIGEGGRDHETVNVTQDSRQREHPASSSARDGYDMSERHDQKRSDDRPRLTPASPQGRQFKSSYLASLSQQEIQHQSQLARNVQPPSSPPSKFRRMQG